MADSEEDSQDPPRMQHLFVMRHGDRMDDFDPSWLLSAPRPWDPPLTEVGKMKAWAAGKRLRGEGWNVTRVFCSPFLRCVQTAAEVINALCAVESLNDGSRSSRGAAIDPSKVKVSIEYGLCEVMNKMAIRIDNLPPEGPSTLDIRELEELLPAGTVDHSVQPKWSKLPAWQETTTASHQRYKEAFQTAADMFPGENVLCVTHGEGVGVSVSMCRPVSVYQVDYCAHSHAQRSVYSFSSPPEAGKFELITESEIESGIFFQE